MTRRRPTKDELDLWRKVTSKATRLENTLIKGDAPAVPKNMPKPARSSETPKPSPFRVGQSAATSPPAHVLKPSVSDQIKADPLQMDRKAFARMKRGKLKPEGRIDLHGMTLDRAHPALNRFILSAQAAGKRLVLVITGKGRDKDDGDPIPTPRGVLKTQVPHWLRTPPLSQAVLQVTEAHISHGGGGAYYVYLRRAR